jgi:hypothetical protein
VRYLESSAVSAMGHSTSKARWLNADHPGSVVAGRVSPEAEPPQQLVKVGPGILARGEHGKGHKCLLTLVATARLFVWPPGAPGTVTPGPLLAALLDVRLHELLGVVL